jgi:predicted nucleic acid-binding protein
MRLSKSTDATVSEWVYNEIAHVMKNKKTPTTDASVDALWKLIKDNCTCLNASVPHDKQDQIRLNALQLTRMRPQLGIGITDAYIIETARAHGIDNFISFDIAWEFIDDITVWTLPDDLFERPSEREAKRKDIIARLHDT